MLYVDEKYARLAGLGINLFAVKKHSPFLAIGRCPICGDSKKSTHKCRFFFIQKKNGIMAKCHNCGYAGNMYQFLEKVDQNLLTGYVFEKFKQNIVRDKPEEDYSFLSVDYEKKEEPKKILGVEEKFAELPSVWDLNQDHPYRVYLEERKIPKKEFLYCEEFNKFARNFNDDFETKKNEHARIVIPFRNREGKIYAFQARTLGKEIPKYYTIIIDEEQPKFYNYDFIKPGKDIYIIEGPIDSMYIPNCAAALSSALESTAIKFQDMLNNCLEEYVLVYDNEPRNWDVVKLQERAIDNKYRTVIWPSSFRFKDINDAVKSGIKPIEIYHIIKENTFSGLEAKLRFTNWKKC
ncbi:hypothetical protein [Synechococcus phage BUCT-ZZ01]|nr:hypothetical protein [Synechococcus phage BUCT-ZZ01]